MASAWRWYLQQLSRRPFVANALTASTVAFTGDIFAQFGFEKTALFASYASDGSSSSSSSNGSSAHKLEVDGTPVRAPAAGGSSSPASSPTTSSTKRIATQQTKQQEQQNLAGAPSSAAASSRWDWERSCRLAGWGLLTGGFVVYWFRFLDRVPPRWYAKWFNIPVANPLAGYGQAVPTAATMTPASATAAIVNAAITGNAAAAGATAAVKPSAMPVPMFLFHGWHKYGVIALKVMCNQSIMAPFMNSLFFGWIIFTRDYLFRWIKESSAASHGLLVQESASSVSLLAANAQGTFD